MFACFHLYFSLPLVSSTPSSYFLSPLPLIIIHTTCISLSLRWTSAPIHLASVLGVLGTQETSCILIAGLLEREYFDHFLPEFDKPWVIHLRENLLLFYKPLHLEAQQLPTRIEVRRHQWSLHLSWINFIAWTLNIESHSLLYTIISLSKIWSLVSLYLFWSCYSQTHLLVPWYYIPVI